MNKRSKTFDPVKCYEQLRSNMLTDPYYTSRGQHLLQHQGMCCWLGDIERLNSRLASPVTATQAILTTPSPASPADTGVHSRLNVLLSEIVLSIYKGGL